MTTRIHPTAVVDPRAALGCNVTVGPFCFIEADTEIGDDCTLEARAIIKSRTTLGSRNSIGEGAVLGGAPQDPFSQEPGGTLSVGNGNQIRENVTVHRGLLRDAATIIRDNNLLMVSSHVGHDCQVGSRCTLVNHVLLAGHVEINDGACLGGASTFGEHCRVGRLAMIGAVAKVEQDVPPYVMVAESKVVGLNRVGLARNGFTPQEMRELKDAYHIIYRQGLRWDDVLATLRARFTTGPASEFSDFLASGQRGFVQERRLPPKATLKFAEASVSRG